MAAATTRAQPLPRPRTRRTQRPPISAFARLAESKRRQLVYRERMPRTSRALEAAHVHLMSTHVRVFTAHLIDDVLSMRGELGIGDRHDALGGAFKRLASKAHGLASRAANVAAGVKAKAHAIGAHMRDWSATEALRTLGSIASHGKEVATGFAEDFAAKAGDIAAAWSMEAIERAEGVIETAQTAAIEWDTFAALLRDAMDGIISRTVQSARNMVTQGSADLNQQQQEAAGVEQYVWVCVNQGNGDDRVRGIPGGKYPGHHWQLNFQLCRWDDPPLKGSDSTSGEDCHPGDDYQCRCGASPVLPEDYEMNGEGAPEPDEEDEA